MDVDPVWLIIIFVFFIFGPLIERVLKGGRQRLPPPGQRPQQRTPPGRVQPGTRGTLGPGGEPAGGQAGGGDATSREPVSAQRDDGDQSAAEMLPEDLWRILTGGAPRPGGPAEAPPKPAKQKAERGNFEVAPLPAELEPLPTGRERAAAKRPRYESPAPEVLPDEEAIAAERMRRRRAETRRRHAPRTAVSLETEVAPEAIRHQKFHDQLDTLAPPPKANRRRTAALPVGHLHGRNALRQAILIQEILGTPKGLQEEE